MDDKMSIQEARLKLGEAVDRARLANQFTVITRQGKPAAMIVSVEWYKRANADLARHLAEMALARADAARKADMDARSEDEGNQS